MRGSPWPAIVLWLAILSAVALYPLLMLAIVAIRGLSVTDEGLGLGVSWGLLGRSCAWALVIGVLSSCVGWVGAWASRGWRAWWTPLLIAPILMPSSLASSGFGLLRAPGTAIGDWLAMGPAWRPVLAGRVIAVLGLALWASPLAQMVVAARVRAIDPDALEAARLTGGGWRAWLRLRFGMSRWHTLLGAGVVTLLMLGSAVPLHLAQMDTYATRVWLELDATTPDQRWRVIAQAWPLLLIAMTAGGILTLHFRKKPTWLRGSGTAESHASTLATLLALGVVALAVVLPAALFAIDLESWSTMSTLWRTEAQSVRSAWLVALLVALASVAVSSSVWIGLSANRWAARLTLLGVWVILTMALLPGVVTGVIIQSAWWDVPAVGESWAIVWIAHMARFGALAAIAGAVLAWSEGEEDRDLRRLAGATGIWGWFRTVGGRSMPLVALAAIAAAAFSLHEIESAIVVAPPGMASLSRSMLSLLHFQRYEHLAGLSLIVVGFGTLPVMVLSGFWWLAHRKQGRDRANHTQRG